MQYPALAAVLLALATHASLAAAQTAPAAATAAVDLQAQLEQHKALAAETLPPVQSISPPPRARAKGLDATSAFRLFAGLDDALLDAIRMNPATNAVLAAFDGTAVWAAAWDDLEQRVLFTEGSTLHEWRPGSPPALLGTTTSPEAVAMVFTALAWHDGVLYGTRSSVPEGLFRIDTDTLVATVVASYDTTYDIGGLAIDPVSGVFYGTNDATGGVGRGLVTIGMDGAVSLVAPYPEGNTDIDGLAIGDGRAYLVTDDAAGSWPVFDFASMAYVEPLLSPFLSSEVFSGAAWIRDPFRFTLSEAHGWEVGDETYTRFSNPRVLPGTASIPSDNTFRAGERIGDRVFMLDEIGNAVELDAGSGALLRSFGTGVPATGGVWSGMAHDPVTGATYVSSTSGAGSSLYAWNPATGNANLIGDITNADWIVGIAFDGAGALWGYDDGDSVLVTINPANGFSAVVGPLGVDSDLGAGLGWDPADDTLYASVYLLASTRGQIRRVDRSTGATVPVAITGADTPGSPAALFWLAFGPPVTGIFSDGFEPDD